MTYPAITLWQPHASLLVVTPPGEERPSKRYETRSWMPAKKYIGMRFAIHAGINATALRALARYLIDRDDPMTDLDPTADAQISSILAMGYADLSYLPRGAVIGTAVLSAVHRAEDLTDPGHLGDFSAGRYAWEFTDHSVFPEPIPAAGKQGIWRWEL